MIFVPRPLHVTIDELCEKQRAACHVVGNPTSGHDEDLMIFYLFLASSWVCYTHTNSIFSSVHFHIEADLPINSPLKLFKCCIG